MVFEKVIQKDSVIENHQLQLWPIGKFKYSASEGFEGNASKLRLDVKQTKVSNLKQNKTSTENLSAKTEFNSKQKSTEKLKAKSVWSYANYLFFFIAIVLGFLGYYLVKRYLKFKWL